MNSQKGTFLMGRIRKPRPERFTERQVYAVNQHLQGLGESPMDGAVERLLASAEFKEGSARAFSLFMPLSVAAIAVMVSILLAVGELEIAQLAVSQFAIVVVALLAVLAIWAMGAAQTGVASRRAAIAIYQQRHR